jgi:hypothetical protein
MLNIESGKLRSTSFDNKSGSIFSKPDLRRTSKGSTKLKAVDSLKEKGFSGIFVIFGLTLLSYDSLKFISE